MPWTAVSIGEVAMKVMSSGLALAFLACLPSLAQAGHHHVVTVPGGDVHFIGAVVKAACVVDTNSDALTVEMGQVRSSIFSGAGSWGHPQPFSIVLKDCDTNISKQVGVAFNGVTDARDPAVLAVTSGAGSAGNVGIGIFDSAGNLMIPNTQPQRFSTLKDDTNVLSFIAKYRATAANVTPGEADAQTWFTLTYM